MVHACIEISPCSRSAAFMALIYIGPFAYMRLACVLFNPCPVRLYDEAEAFISASFPYAQRSTPAMPRFQRPGDEERV